MNQKLEELLANTEFVKKIISLKDKEDVKNYFINSGYHITDEEIEELKTIFGKIYSEINNLNNEEKESLSTNITPEELQNISGGTNNGAVIGAAIGTGAVVAAQIVGRKKISSACKKVWNKCLEPTILNGKHDGKAELMYFATIGMSTIIPLIAGVAGVTAITAGAVAAGGSTGYLIGKTIDKRK